MRTVPTDLLGEPLPPPAFLRKNGGRRKIGYAARLGTGPKCQRCATCASCSSVLHHGATTKKCERLAHAWTHGAETDIHPNAPACKEWERRCYAQPASI